MTCPALVLLDHGHCARRTLAALGFRNILVIRTYLDTTQIEPNIHALHETFQGAFRTDLLNNEAKLGEHWLISVHLGGMPNVNDLNLLLSCYI